METRLNIEELAQHAGLPLAGVAPAKPLDHMTGKLQERLSANRFTPFEELNPARHVTPDYLLPGCRSIIVIGLPYPTTFSSSPMLTGLRGKVARCAQGFDYHLILNEAGERLVELIRQATIKPFRYRILADRSPLLERELARMAGLGISGRNCSLINGIYGSHVALGTILLDLELPPGEPLEETCRGCGKCQEACPTGAFERPYILNPLRCLSYLNQASGVMPREYRPLMGTRLYGCDTCQDVCPHNRDTAAAAAASFPFFPGAPLLPPILRLTRKEFDQTIALSAAGWRGKTTLQRNAIVALGNWGNPEASAELARILREDPRPVIRLHAAWALGRLNNGTARRTLESSRQREKEPAVLEEINCALEDS